MKTQWVSRFFSFSVGFAVSVAAMISTVPHSAQAEDKQPAETSVQAPAEDSSANKDQFVITVVVTERGTDGKVHVIASPKIVTTGDQFAQLSVLDPVPEDKVIIRGGKLEDPLEAGMIVRLNIKDLGHNQVRVDVTFDMRRLVVNDEKVPMLAGTSARSILAQRLGKSTKMVALADEKGLAQRWIELTVNRAEKR